MQSLCTFVALTTITTPVTAATETVTLTAAQGRYRV
jgi:hypothetical protein